MTISQATVPNNMSYINAFRALWESSKPARFFESQPETLELQEATVSTSEKVTNYFKKMQGRFVDYAGGRLIKTDFANFPKLRVYGYDKEYGAGAAQKALNAYNQISTDLRFDKNDSSRFSDLPKMLKVKL